MSDKVKTLLEDVQHFHGPMHEDPVHRIEDELPGEDNRDDRSYVGQQYQHADQAAQGKLPVHHQGYSKSNQGRPNRSANDIDQRG